MKKHRKEAKKKAKELNLMSNKHVTKHHLNTIHPESKVRRNVGLCPCTNARNLSLADSFNIIVVRKRVCNMYRSALFLYYFIFCMESDQVFGVRFLGIPVL